MNKQKSGSLLSAVRSESGCWAALTTAVIFVAFGASWFNDLSNNAWLALLFAWIFGVMLWAAFGAVRHAECLAVQLGEPFGTLILTLSVTGIEVMMIIAVMSTGAENPTLVRDTMFSVVMLQLNGLVGLVLLLGGVRHGEQYYNLQGNAAYLVVIVTLAVLSLVLPRFTASTADASAAPHLAWFLVAASVILYGVFLGIQTLRHRDYFMPPGESLAAQPERVDGDHRRISGRVAYHAFFLVLTLTVLAFLSRRIAVLIDHSIAKLAAPVALGGLVVAVLVLAPEGLTAVRAAWANKLQRSDNVILGSTLATIGLTVPAVLVVSSLTGKTVELGLGDVGLILLLLTILINVINATSRQTNVLQGVVHLVLFAAYLVLMFD